MVENKFNLNSAKEYAKNDNIENWVHDFLNGVGNNKPLSDGLKLQKRYWIGPVEIELEKLNRCCGPEEDMQYYNPPEAWNERINRLQNLIQDNWEMPPLIIEHDQGTLWVRDGNGRHEALKREGILKTWVIIWDSNSQEQLNNII